MYTLSAFETDHETTTGTGVGTNVTPGTGHPPPPVAVNELIVGFITIVVGVVVKVVVVELVVDEVVVALVVEDDAAVVAPLFPPEPSPASEVVVVTSDDVDPLEVVDPDAEFVVGVKSAPQDAHKNTMANRVIRCSLMSARYRTPIEQVPKVPRAVSRSPRQKQQPTETAASNDGHQTMSNPNIRIALPRRILY